MDAIAKAHKRRARFAVAQGLQTAHFGEAAGPVCRADVGHRARADHRARHQRAGLGAVRNQGGEVESHVPSGVRRAHQVAVERRAQRQMQAGAIPGLAQLVSAHQHRREGGPGLGLIKAELLAQFRGNQLAQGHIVDQPDQLNVLSGLSGADPGGHIVGDHRHFGLEIDAPVLAFHGDGVLRADKGIRGPHIHQGVFPERGGQFGAARLAHQLDVGHVGAAIGPVIGPRQGRGAARDVKRFAGADLAGAQRGVARFEPGRDARPIVEGAL